MEYSQTTPALTAYSNHLWVAFIGKSTHDLYVCSSKDGLNWSEHTDINQTSGFAPALASYNGKLWLAFAGNTSGDVLVCTYDGNAWSANTQVPEQTTASGPALAVFNDKLWVAFIAQNGSDDLLICSYDHKTSKWSGSASISNQSSKAPPTLAVLGGNLWISFVGNTTNDLHSFYSPDGKSWTSTTPNQTSFAQPALATHGNTLYLAFAGNTTNDLLVSHWNGSAWTGNTAIPQQTTSNAPALAEFNGKLYASFISADASDRLFICSSPDGSSWSPASQVGNYPTSRTLLAGTAAHTISYGSYANEAQFFATLVLNSNGDCTFSGTYTNNGTLPVLTAYAQNYSVGMVVSANGKVFTFEHSGTAQNASTDSWNVSTTNAAVAANWPALVSGASQASSTNNAPPGGFLSAIGSAISQLLGIAETVVEDAGTVIAIIGGSAAGVSASSNKGGATGGAAPTAG